MKKFVLLFAIIALFVGSVNAQNGTVKVGASSSWEFQTVEATDIIDADGENIEKIFDLGSKNKIQYYTIFLDVDVTARDGELMAHTIPITLQESYDGINYNIVSTVSFYGTADTTFTIADLSTGSIAPYLKVKLDGSDADSVSVQLMKMAGKFVNK